MATLLGWKKPKRGRERVNSVSQVIKKWKAANVSWASLSEGSEKIALFVKTCSCTKKRSCLARDHHNESWPTDRASDNRTYNANRRQRVHQHPDEGRSNALLLGFWFLCLLLSCEEAGRGVLILDLELLRRLQSFDTAFAGAEIAPLLIGIIGLIVCGR